MSITLALGIARLIKFDFGKRQRKRHFYGAVNKIRIMNCQIDKIWFWKKTKKKEICMEQLIKFVLGIARLIKFSFGKRQTKRSVTIECDIGEGKAMSHIL